MRRASVLLVTAIGLHGLPAMAQQPPGQHMIAAVQRLPRQRPTDPKLHYFLASFQARAGEPHNGLSSLRKADEYGDGFLPSRGVGFDGLKDDPHYLASTLLAAGTLGGCNGVVLSKDGAILYVAHSTGLARIELASAKVVHMAPPPQQTIAAIDGLYLLNGDLIGIQNVTNPGRVSRMRLDQTGMQIAGIDTLQSHHNPAFDQPTTGAMVGKDVFLLATTQLPQYNDKGEVISGERSKQPAIVKVPLL